MYMYTYGKMLGGIPKTLVLCDFLKILMVSDKMIHKWRLLELIQLYQNETQIRENFHFQYLFLTLYYHQFLTLYIIIIFNYNHIMIVMMMMIIIIIIIIYYLILLLILLLL